MSPNTAVAFKSGVRVWVWGEDGRYKQCCLWNVRFHCSNSILLLSHPWANSTFTVDAGYVQSNEAAMKNPHGKPQGHHQWANIADRTGHVIHKDPQLGWYRHQKKETSPCGQLRWSSTKFLYLVDDIPNQSFLVALSQQRSTQATNFSRQCSVLCLINVLSWKLDRSTTFLMNVSNGWKFSSLGPAQTNQHSLWWRTWYLTMRISAVRSASSKVRWSSYLNSLSPSRIFGISRREFPWLFEWKQTFYRQDISLQTQSATDSRWMWSFHRSSFCR